MVSARSERQRGWMYECELRHVRTSPLRHAFNYRTYLWLVDLDAPPRLPRVLRALAGFDARDHFGEPALGLRANVTRFLAGAGIDLRGGPVLMLAGARVFGHVFNPLTVFWCRYPDGTPAAVLAEVHNTYGGRHCYVLEPDARDLARTDKDFYVSPFFPVDGEYRMHLPEPGDRLDLSINLHRGEHRPFVASLRGGRRAATPAMVARGALSMALTLARIRRHGIALYLRGLPVQPRPTHEEILK